MKKLTMRKNWLQQPQPTKFFDMMDNKLIEPRPIEGQEPKDVLNPKPIKA